MPACPTCSYNLADLPDGVCPECGSPFISADLIAADRSRKRQLNFQDSIRPALIATLSAAFIFIPLPTLALPLLLLPIFFLMRAVEKTPNQDESKGGTFLGMLIGSAPVCTIGSPDLHYQSPLTLLFRLTIVWLVFIFASRWMRLASRRKLTLLVLLPWWVRVGWLLTIAFIPSASQHPPFAWPTTLVLTSKTSLVANAALTAATATCIWFTMLHLFCKQHQRPLP